MGAPALTSIGLTALMANQAALQTVGQNIANANTPGYSRQSVVLTTPNGQFTGQGFFGAGVQVQTVSREHDDFLTKQANDSAAVNSMDQASLTQLQQLQQLFPVGAQGLGNATATFLNAMVDVANNPSDPSARQVVIGNGQDLAQRFSGIGQQLQALQAGVVTNLKSNVDSINQLTTQIAAANAAILGTAGTGHQPNDLLDQRDKLVSQLSQYLQVSTLTQTDGSVSVFAGGGQQLVLGTKAESLKVLSDTYDPNMGAVGISQPNGVRVLDQSALSGGSLTALMNFQNNDLQQGRNLLGQIATSLSYAVNSQQALGWTLSTPPTAGPPMFSVGSPQAFPASSNARNPDGSFASQVSLTITDATQLQASAYMMSADPANAGQYLITRKADGLVRSVPAGGTVDGFQINVLGNTPASNDSFLLEPVSSAAANMKSVLSQASGIAAASPVSATIGANNTGTAAVDSVHAVNSQLNLAETPMTITFGATDPTVPNGVDYTITLADGTQLPGVWQPNQPIGNQPTANPAINLGFELNLSGVPKSGDTVSVTTTLFPATNNGNAKAFLALQNSALVGQKLQPDGSLAAGASVNDAYAEAIADIGSRVQGAQYLANVSKATASNAETARSGQAGVNLDEEAARLMQYQQGYQAAAKVLQTAQAVFSQLLQLGQG